MGRWIRSLLLGSVGFLLVLAAWQLLFSLGLIKAWTLSSPAETFVVLWRLVSDGSLAKLLMNSLTNLLPAFFMSAVFSLLLGILIGSNNLARRILMPFLAAVNAVPSLAWLPLLILVLGFTRQTVWAVIFISCFHKMIYSVIGGVRNIDRNWLLAARNLELGRCRTVLKVIVPGALPQIMSGLRLGFGSSWRSLIGAEMLLVSAGGLGKYIWMSQWAARTSQVLAGIVVIALVGVLVEQLIFRQVERYTLIRWGMIES
ncbi:MAG: ABC transporter permease [bacterium]